MSRERKIVVAVSGGFDPLHIGHVRLFERAKKMGDDLVVILNNDNWLKKKKGSVFMPEIERKEIIKALACVDRVVLTAHKPNSSDMSVCAELEKIKPDIFANGGDRFKKNIPEIAVCEEIGCKMVFGMGRGGKVQSSSWLLANHLGSENKSKKNFEVIARAVILHNNKILLCKQKNKDYYFLPGGHVEWGEGAEYALARELKEELNASFEKYSFIGVTENFFSGRQEVNIVFSVSGGKPSAVSVEDHLEFCFVSKEKFSKMNIVPKSMKVAVIKWFKNKKSFLVSEGVK